MKREAVDRCEDLLGRYRRLLKRDAVLVQIGELLTDLGVKSGAAEMMRLRGDVAKDLEECQDKAYAQLGECLNHGAQTSRRNKQ